MRQPVALAEVVVEIVHVSELLLDQRLQLTQTPEKSLGIGSEAHDI